MHIEIVDVITPQNYQHRGAWVGAEKPESVFIFIHGLTSDLFSGRMIFGLADKKNAVLSFNNRGYGIVSKLKHLNPNNPKGYDSEMGGTTHEIFKDCVDDIKGAIHFAKEQGAKNIYLVGHSTGCQKSIFYLSKTHDKNVTGVALLCPLSDYAMIVGREDKTQYKKAFQFAQVAVKKGKPRTLLTETYWPEELLDAQRFLSLYTPESAEEIFTYAHDKKPTTFQSVQMPMLVILAGADEYADRTPEKLVKWFDDTNKSTRYKSAIINKATHNLKDSEEKVCKEIKGWAIK